MRPDELFADESQQAVGDASAFLARRQRFHRADVEDVSLDRGALDRLALLAAELIEA